MSAIKASFREYFEKVQIWYYKRELRKMSELEKLIWADKHPTAKRLLGLRGWSQLSILERSCFSPSFNRTIDEHQCLTNSCLSTDKVMKD